MINEKTKKALAQLEKEFKNITVLGKAPRVKVDAISTGSVILDQMFGCGGWPKGRISELFGMESSGKTTLCYHAVANAQKLGTVGFIDTEHRVQLDYAVGLGVDPDNLVFSQPSSGEEAFDLLINMLKANAFSLIILDSLAHAKPKSIADSDLSSANIGTHAKLCTKAFDIIGKIVGNTAVIITNQLRKDPSGYGSGEFTPGGLALKFDASLRVRLQKRPVEKDDEDTAILNKVAAKVVKTSVGPPYKEGEFTIRFGKGVDINDDTLDAAILAGIIKKSGGNHSILINEKKESIGRSRDQALIWLDQKGRAEKIKAAILKSKWYKEDSGSSSGENGEIPQASGTTEEVESIPEMQKVRTYFLKSVSGAASPIREAEMVDDTGDTDGADEEDGDTGRESDTLDL